MALKSTTKNSPKATPRKSSAPVVKQSRTVASKPTQMTDAQKKAEALKAFLPENLKYIKDVFGLDLESKHVSAKVVADIAAGRVTDPVELVVRPLAYDKDKKETVEMPPIKVVASVKIVLPYERGTFKQVPHDDEHRVFFASYPCFDYLVKDNASEIEEQQVQEKQKLENVSFTKDQVKALEALGIREERLYPGYNSLSADVKAAIAAGQPFPVTGSVRISDGTSDSKIDVNLNGMAQMRTTSGGQVITKFEPQYPVEQGKNRVIDLLNIRRVGNIELDFFERTPSGSVKTDVYNKPIINKAGKDVIRYGVAFGPVDGFIHKRTYDKKEHKFVDSVEKAKYQVSVVNGGLCISPMEKVFEKGQDGKPVMTKVNGKDVEKYHYEVRDARIKDGKVYVNGEYLEPASAKELENYKKGLGGVFKDAKWTEYKEGKKVVTKYDAFVVPDNQKNGFAKSFSPTASAKIVSELDNKKVGKKQNFSMGF